jgi:hypothetical protein
MCQFSPNSMTPERRLTGYAIAAAILLAVFIIYLVHHR